MRCCLNWCRGDKALYDGPPEGDTVSRRGPGQEIPARHQGASGRRERRYERGRRSENSECRQTKSVDKLPEPPPSCFLKRKLWRRQRRQMSCYRTGWRRTRRTSIQVSTSMA
ncbi:hypothetical protein JG688_00004264 [Phytophthora aleatoria]|uniref:Uncharacterized protein n=1 Tax=Phytophthora aleatoria TaxID=2496075 RepID=A0A8J5J237_9STRA|nr:hypothetical protein JG688_00004264 [Phytophthora aleatoria]